MQNKKVWIISAGSLLAIIVLLVWQPWDNNQDKSDMNAKVIKGTFETYVTAIGELQAQQSLDITVPAVSHRSELRIRHIKILSIVEEGKIVKKGDIVATLDPSEVEEHLTELDQWLSDLYNDLENAKLDSSLELSEARDFIQKSQDFLLDAEIKVEQSVYESKAIQRQSHIELEQAQRSLEKAKRDFVMLKRKLIIHIERDIDKITRFENEKSLTEQLITDMKIKAPADGMVVYGRDHNGNKIRTGSTVGRYDPLIATLPDLNTIVSELFVKEIDISKVKLGQTVRIQIDAFPNKEFFGKIIEIANIGQEIPGEFQNGFEVLVKLDSASDPLLPGMTTTNLVITGSWEDALMIPKKAVFGNDSSRFVFKKSGLSVIEQEVQIAGENEDFFRITDGLNEGDKVLLEYFSQE